MRTVAVASLGRKIEAISKIYTFVFGCYVTRQTIHRREKKY